VTTRSILVASLPTGPQDPLTGTPTRPPGSVRRTTSIDQRRGDPGQPMALVASGRDLRTNADGTAEVVDEVRLRATIDASGTLTTVESDPPEPRLATLVGAHTSRGFRQRADEAVPDHRDRTTVLHQLLDDVPMAALISGYGSTREQGDDWELPAGTAEGLADLCAGWERGATMLGALEATGIFPIPIGPAAPDLGAPDDPLAWHDMGPMVERSVRRRRRLDLSPGTPLCLDVHFRDSHLGTDGVEDVLHEYTLAATIDPVALIVRSSEATVRVLPWPECPGAVASAGRIVGEPVTALRRRVAAELKGTSTCTHLNDVLRSVAGVTALAAALR
jgi:Protein of unknown function (DUF2889)